MNRRWRALTWLIELDRHRPTPDRPGARHGARRQRPRTAGTGTTAQRTARAQAPTSCPRRLRRSSSGSAPPSAASAARWSASPHRARSSAPPAGPKRRCRPSPRACRQGQAPPATGAVWSAVPAKRLAARDIGQLGPVEHAYCRNHRARLEVRHRARGIARRHVPGAAGRVIRRGGHLGLEADMRPARRTCRSRARNRPTAPRAWRRSATIRGSARTSRSRSGSGYRPPHPG